MLKIYMLYVALLVVAVICIWLASALVDSGDEEIQSWFEESDDLAVHEDSIVVGEKEGSTK